MTVKAIVLAKKRRDMSFADFRHYYSTHHIQFMNRLLRHGAAVHRRNFVTHPDPSRPGDYDVISEVFYEDIETAKATAAELADPEVMRARILDEERFLIPESVRVFLVDTETTVFRPLPDLDYL